MDTDKLVLVQTLAEKIPKEKYLRVPFLEILLLSVESESQNMS